MEHRKLDILKQQRDFPGGPVVKFRLPMRGVRVQSLVGELDPTCLAAKKPKHRTEAIL